MCLGLLKIARWQTSIEFLLASDLPVSLARRPDRHGVVNSNIRFPPWQFVHCVATDLLVAQDGSIQVWLVDRLVCCGRRWLWALGVAITRLLLNRPIGSAQ